MFSEAKRVILKCHSFLLVLMISLLIPYQTLLAAKPPESAADYIALKGQCFKVNRMGEGKDAWSEVVELKLLDVSEPVKNGKIEQFSVRFQSPKGKPLDKTVHRFEHAATGPFTLFLEPAGADKKNNYYQAVFSLIK